MSGAIAEAGGRNLTELYLDFAADSSASGLDDSVVTADEWPPEVGSQVTMGFEVKQPHAEPGRVVIAARVAELATATALGKSGTESAWGTVNPATFARSKTYQTLLSQCLSHERGAGQPAGLYLVTNFWSPTTAHLRTSTLPKTSLTIFRRGGARPEILSAHDDLSITSSVSRIRSLSVSATRNVLSRDFGICPTNDTFEALSRWAIIRSMPRLAPESDPGRVHFGQFVAACEEIKRQFSGTEDQRRALLAQRIGPAYSDYVHLVDEVGVAPAWPRTPSFQRFSPSKIQRRALTVEDLHHTSAITSVALGRQMMPARRPLGEPHRAANRTLLAEGSALPLARAQELLSTGEITLTDARRFACQAVQRGMRDCREERATAAEIAARRQQLRSEVLPRIFRDYPYLAVSTVASLEAGHRAFGELAPFPDHAMSQLRANAHQAAQGQDVPFTAWTSAYAAALMGDKTARRQAAEYLSQYRASLRKQLLRLLPVINGRTLEDVTDMQQRYGTNVAEIERAGIRLASLDVDLPLDLYTMAALSVVDRTDPSLPYTTHTWPDGRMARLRGNKPAPDAAAVNATLNTKIAPLLYEEAARQLGQGTAPLYRTDAAGDVMYSTDGKPLYNYPVADSLVLCRLADALHAEVAVQYPQYQEVISRRLGPLIEQSDWRIVRHQLPQAVNNTLSRYLKRYQELAATAWV